MSTEFIRRMKERYNALLEYFDNPSSAEDKYDDLVNLITSHIKKDKNEFRCLLELISCICNNHNRSYNLINKIEQLLTHFKADIQKYFMNSEIFDFFKDNKRILLLLIENEIILIDEYIFSKITSTKYVSMNYLEYFQPEISPFLTTELINKYKSQNPDLAKKDFIEKIKNQEITDIFYEKRREGENDNYLCRVIRDNAIDDFIIFETQSGLPLNSFIKSSIFETNSFLIENNRTTLIEYAAFCGSLDIFKHIVVNNVKLKTSIWLYAIHGRNAEIIKNYLEENHIEPPHSDYLTVFNESIECHHNEISTYFLDNFINSQNLQYNTDSCRRILKSHNYFFFPEKVDNKFWFCSLCEFNYIILFKLFIQEENTYIDSRNVFNYCCFK